MSILNKEDINKIFKQGELAFYWQAFKKNGEVYPQFVVSDDMQLIENSFSEIDNYPEKFSVFELVSLENPDVKFKVNLENGDFEFNGVTIKNNINIEGKQLKCTFWRRKAITVNISEGKESAKYLFYTLGWHTNIEGANIKKEYKIFSDYTVQEILYKQSRKLFGKGLIVKK